MAIQKAFISDAAFTIDDHGYAAVVTAKAIDRDTGKMEITCDILGYVEPISIRLDQDDLIAVRGLLDLPDMDNYFAAFDVAMKALNDIAADYAVPTTIEAWRNLAIHYFAVAARALTKIQDPETPDATSNDS